MQLVPTRTLECLAALRYFGRECCLDLQGKPPSAGIVASQSRPCSRAKPARTKYADLVNDVLKSRRWMQITMHSGVVYSSASSKPELRMFSKVHPPSDGSRGRSLSMCALQDQHSAWLRR